MHEPKADAQADRELEALRAALLTEEALPLGMTARLEAGVARAARAEEPSWSARLVVAALAFVAVGIVAGDRLGGSGVLLVACAALAYAWGFALIVAGHDRAES